MPEPQKLPKRTQPPPACASSALSRSARRARPVSGTTRMRRNGSCYWPARRDCASRMKPNRGISAPAIGWRSRRIAAIGSIGPIRTSQRFGSPCFTARSANDEPAAAARRRVPRPRRAFRAGDGCGGSRSRTLRLSPDPVHGADKPGGRAAGPGRHRQSLRDAAAGYVEILTAVATPGGNTVLARQLRERIADHVGLHLAAFSSADAAAEHRRLAEAGFATLPLVDMRRPVTTHTGSEDARFTIARIAHHSMPEGRVQFLTHHTETLVWRDGFLDHPNGARALTGLWIAAEEPAEPTARFGRFTGRPASHAGEVTKIALARGAIHIARPRYLRDAFGITPAGTLPCFVATQIAVADLAILERCLREAGLSSRPVRLASADEAIALDLPAALGGAMLFHPS